MINWLHRLFNPHCPHCREDKEESKICASCETLKTQLTIVNAEKQRMLDALLEKPKIEQEHKIQVNPREIKANMLTWNARRQMLEAEDRKSAQLIKDKLEAEGKLKPAKSVEELERELEIPDAQAVGTGNEKDV